MNIHAFTAAGIAALIAVSPAAADYTRTSIDTITAPADPVVQALIPEASRIGGSAGNAVANSLSSMTAPKAAPAAQRTARASSAKTTQYSFKCPSGTSASVSISYKTDACLSAKKQMTKIYSCNMIDDFGKVASICSSGCGSPQCSD